MKHCPKCHLGFTDTSNKLEYCFRCNGELKEGPAITDTEMLDWLEDVRCGVITPPDEYPGDLPLRIAIRNAMLLERNKETK